MFAFLCKQLIMSTKTISYIAIISLVLVFFTQAFLVVDYFTTVREALIRESEAILTEAFRSDLNQRNNRFKELYSNQIEEVSQPQRSNESVVDFNMSGTGNQEGILNRLDLVIHTFVSNVVPLDIQVIDSITGHILHGRNINSEYLIQIVEPKSELIISNSKEFEKASFFLIPSKPYPLDFEDKQALRLILINPFSLIIKRMGVMLLSSMIFSVICLLAFRFLIKILAKQKQLVKFKNEFLSNIAHELKRPVSSLIVNLECLQMEEMFNDMTTRDRMLNNSINSMTELNGTISMIVGLAKVEEGLFSLNKQPVNLVKIIDDLKSRFISSPSKRVTIQTHYESTDEIIPGDHLMLTQCFANLIDNSIKYSGADVVIDISLKISTNSVILNFKDDGIGIPAEKIGNIFEKYSRVDNNTRVNGFGIGLNYVKTIIEKHGGSISVSSESGKGSDFRVTLPKR